MSGSCRWHATLPVGAEPLTPWAAAGGGAGGGAGSGAGSGHSAHWGDFRVLKRGLVRRWEDIAKLETCLQSLWSKRGNLERALGEAQGEARAAERALPAVGAAIEALKRDVGEAEARLREAQDAAAAHKGKDAEHSFLGAANRRSGSPCPCWRFNALQTSADLPPNPLCALPSPVGGRKALRDDLHRYINRKKGDLVRKVAEQRDLEGRRHHLEGLVQRLTCNLAEVDEEREAATARWRSYRCELEKLETQMKEQWGASALDRMTPATASRSRFF